MVSLTVDEERRYFDAIKGVVREAIGKGGRNSEPNLLGEGGDYIPEVGRDTAGASCSVCGTAVVKFSFEGGACYVCPGCQPPP